MTENEARSLYVNTAKKYLGVTEGSATHHAIIDRYNTITPLPVDYKVTYSDDWCAAFVSAVAQECGMTDVIFPECGCGRMRDLYIAAGRWEESDNYVPSPGDIIMYDWEDSGNGDNTGGCDHVGIVTACDGSTITVIEGNKSGNPNNVAYRTVSVNGLYIRGFCLPDFGKTSGSGGGEVDTSDPKKIWDFLVAKLGNEYGAAAMMGNLEAESDLCAHRLQNDFTTGYTRSVEYTAQVDSGAISRYDFIHNGPGGGGYGLAQWTWEPRKEALYDMWKSGGYTSIGSLQLALDYLWIELQRDFPGVLSVLKSATSIRTASDKVLHDFENPADQSASVEAKRASMSQAWYDKYHGSTPGGGTTPDEPGEPWHGSGKKMSLLLLIAATRRR